MDAQLEVKLIECLDALAQGESIEQILARYPQDAAQLRPLLQTAAGLPALRMEPSEAVKMRSRQKFMAQAAELRRPVPRKSWAFLPRFATGFVAAGLVAIVLSTGAVAASGSSLPGDPLYGIKRTVENVQLSTSGSPVVREELQREFEQRRRDEANQLLDAGRESEVELTGPIESIQPNSWIVGGLAIAVDAHTSIVGTPQLNRLAEIKGVTGPGGLRASAITIESSGETDKTPEAENTATPEPEVSTETPEPTSTPASTITPTRPVETPRPTARPQPTATAEPVEVEFTGSVQAMDGSSWNIDGTAISVTANTDLRGSINLGQRVKVKALRLGNGQLIATRIEPIDGSGSGDGSGGGNVNPKSNPTPEPTENHNPSPEPTGNHNPSPEPTERHNPSPEPTGNHNPSPEPTGNHNPSPEPTESHNPTPESTKNHD
jgi:hypothetical protein